MEFIGEIIILILRGILQLLGELLLQLIVELFGRSLVEPFRRPKPIHPWLAAIGYIIFGAFAGAMSLWLVPALFISAQWLRLVNLFLTPFIAGVLMASLGSWRERNSKQTIRLDSFTYGFLFAFAMAFVRFTWGH